MKREALQKLNQKANEDRPGFVTEKINGWGFVTALPRARRSIWAAVWYRNFWKWFKIKKASNVGA